MQNPFFFRRAGLKLALTARNFYRLLEVKSIAKRSVKYSYFCLPPSLLENPLAVNYNKNKVKPPTNIDCELLFYSIYDNTVIHLGIDWDSHENYYIPRTFFVEKSNTIDIYTENR